MAVNLSPVGGVAAQFFTNAGVPLSGGKIYTYAAGTTTPQATYTTGAGNIQHSNPIVLDAAGRVPTGEIWLTDGLSYKFAMYDANNVLIATYDNIVGINSNFVNFVNQQEIQTATAGQTVFTLTTMQYQVGTGNLSVFVDGVNQYGPGAQYAYTETSSTVVTFVSGLHVGASVKFTTTEIQNSGIGDASQITYTYPATGAVEESVEDRLAQYVSVKDFGATGDGSTDDTAAIQAAIDAAYSVYFPPTANGYKVSSATLDVPANRKLFGDFSKTKILHVYDGWLFNINGSYVEISGFQIDSSLTSNADSGIFKLRTDTASLERIYFTNIESSAAHYFAKDMNSTGTIVELYFTHCIARLHKGPGIDLRDTFGYLRLENCTIDYVGITASNYRAFRLDNNQGSTWINCDVTGGTVDGTTASQDAFFFNNCVAVWMTNCMADTVGGNGFYLFDGCRYFYLVNCVASLCDGVGFGAGAALGNTSYQLRLSNCTVGGRRLLTYKTALVDGYEFDGCDGVQLSNCEAVDCTGDGYYMNGTTKYNLSNCRADTNTVWGFQSAATGNGVVTGSSFNTNTAGNVSLATNLDHVANCVSTSGALFNLTGPGTA